MRAAIYVALFVACVAAAPVFTRSALASAAAVLFEMLPYAVGAALLAPILGRFAPAAVAFAGCGCGAGPGARSIPATLACAGLFGPQVALTRWLSAIAVAALHRDREQHDHIEAAPLLHDLALLAPAALLAGAITAAAPALALAHQSPFVQVAAGVVLGFAAAPCALGGVALASALHAQSPLASAAMLCVAGIIDLRVWWNPHDAHVRRDRCTYAMLALACAIVADQHGATLVHPRMTFPLWCSAVACLYFALRSRSGGAPSQRMIAATLGIVALVGSPPPSFVATAATLDAIYPGERIDFTGAYETAAGGSPQVIRYAITCCRADARPVGIVLTRFARVRPGTWIALRGVVQRHGDELVVAAETIQQISPPADPFVYL